MRCHPEIIRKLESKLLSSISYQSLKELPCAFGGPIIYYLWVSVPHSKNISTSKNAAPLSPHTHSQTSPARISCCFQGAQSRAHTLGFIGGICLGVCGCILRRCHFPREVSLSLPWLMLSQRNHQCARFRSSDMRNLDSLPSWGT